MAKSKAIELYKERVDTSRYVLQQDIAVWQDMGLKKGSGGQLIQHHIEQFNKYIADAYTMLLTDNPKLPQLAANTPDGEWDSEEFRALVVGVFTNKWGLLREVANQRLPGHPYKGMIEQLDTRAAAYYHTLRTALTKEVQAKLAPFAPLVHFGHLAELTLYNQRAPIIVSVPFGANYESRSQLALAHEIGHALLAQMPEILRDIQKALSDKWQADSTGSQRDQIFQKLIVDWLHELLADILGTVLAEHEFVKSAVWIMATPESSVGTSDPTHPPTDVRPYVHLETLRYLQRKNAPEPAISRSSKIESFEALNKADTIQDTLVDAVSNGRLQRRFKSVPAITVISLEEVRDYLVQSVQIIFDLALPSLEGDSLGNLLLKITQNRVNEEQALAQNVLTNWGKLETTDPLDFVLDFFVSGPPSYGVPYISSHKFCEYFPFLTNWCT